MALVARCGLLEADVPFGFMAAHRVGVNAVRARARDKELGCDVLRVYGYRASCSCGWREKVRPTMRDAYGDRRLHLDDQPPRIPPA